MASQRTGINSLLQMISKGSGMATSNNFAVEIDFQNTEITGTVGTKWSYRGSVSDEETRMMIFCDEASLPGFQVTTGQVTRMTGEAPVYYPTGPVYNDIQLSFMCDAYMTPLHKLNAWMGEIFGNPDSSAETGRRLRYPSEYQAKMQIFKTERSTTSDFGAISSVYTLYDVWPYTIDSTPLSYGSSQLVKITANFYYRSWKLDKLGLDGRQKG